MVIYLIKSVLKCVKDCRSVETLEVYFVPSAFVKET